jgi:hypothetical protein
LYPLTQKLFFDTVNMMKQAESEGLAKDRGQRDPLLSALWPMLKALGSSISGKEET